MLDSLPVLVDQWPIIAGLLLLIALSQMILRSILNSIFGHQLAADESLALALAGWILPASFLSLLWLISGFIFPARIPAIVLLLLIIVIAIPLLRLKTDPGLDSRLTILFLLLFFLISIPARLIFISHAVLPSYFDSAQHYFLIKNLLVSGASFPSTYYHLGYHILTAFAISAFKANIAFTMLILGQLVLALMPVSVFFLIRYITGSTISGILTVILAAFGWYMPAHAVDWGKYPALLSLGLIPFVLSLAYLLVLKRTTLPKSKQWVGYSLLGLSILITILLHSRSLFIFLVVLLAWITASWRQRLPKLLRWLVFFIVILFIMVEIAIVQMQDVFAPLFDPYYNKGFWITAFVLVLSVFAWRSFPQITFACVLTICFMLGCLFIPVNGWIPGYGNLTMLDRPFVEMILYLPLSLLGGLGVSGVEKYITGTRLWLVVGIAAIVMMFHAFATYDWYPSDCCVIAGNDDLTAIGWMDQKLPASARIGISATAMNVLASDEFEGYVGGDAGIWITPLINRAAVPLFFASDFDQQPVLDGICQAGITHIYIGEKGQTFDNSKISNHPGWYKLLLSMPGVKVYQVVGCK